MNISEYDLCVICPRNCSVNRNKGIRGFCNEFASLNIAWAGLHFGEEPPITGKGGSGAIFITGCNLKCCFCQNYQISQNGMGQPVTSELFSSICLKLEKKGASNINIVTGSHHIPKIIEGLNLARKNGLTIPILWNTSSYEKVEQIEKLASCISIWLPDLKTFDSNLSFNLFKAKDYPEIAKKAVLKMASLSPIKYESGGCEPLFENDKLISGVIVRHLALPNHMQDTRRIIKWFSENLKEKALLSIMTQYTPIDRDERKKEFSLDRYIEMKEDESLKELLYKYDIEDGFYQELIQDASWLPNFERENPFSSHLACTIWHWQKGFI